MIPYNEPHHGEPQLVWDIDDAITNLMTAAQLISMGKDKEAADALALAVFSTNEAISRVKDAEYMAKAFPEMKVAA